MLLRIDASSITPGHSAGVEAFTYGLVAGLAEATPYDLEVEVPRGTQADWQEQITDERVRWSEVTTALQTIGPVGRKLRRHLPPAFGASKVVRHVVNRIRDRRRENPSALSDLTFYPFPGVPSRARPAAMVLHDLRWFRAEHKGNGYAAIIRNNVAAASAVVVSWPHPFQQAFAAFPEARDKLVLIPPPAFHARPAGVISRPEPGLLLYPSGTSGHKNHATLLDAMAILPDFRLVCPGPLIEPQASELRARANRSDIRGRISFPGFVSVSELANLYSRAAAVVVPSTWEAASGAIFEAFSWGLPVACADVAPLRAQVEFADGEVRFFAPYDARSIAEAVQRLTAERAHYCTASRHASLRLANRTWADTARDYAEVFAWIHAGSKGPIPRSTFATGSAAAEGLK